MGKMHFLHAVRMLSPLLMGFVLGSLLSLAIFPSLHSSHLHIDCLPDDDHLVEDSEVYEAVIHQPLPGAPNNHAQTQPNPNRKPKVNRPRFYATELGIKDKLFVGVMSSPTTLPTLGVALNLTSSHHVNKMVFFSQGSVATGIISGPMNVVGLNPVENHMEIFRVLEHIGKTVINNYDWFFLVPDSTYVKGFKLFELVSHMSIGKPVVLGKRVPSSEYCDINSGMLLSQDVLVTLIQHLSECEPAVDSTHSTSETIGKCIQLSTNLTCSEEWNGKSLRSWRVGSGREEGRGVEEEWGEVAKESPSTIITLHPLSNPLHTHFLHYRFCQVELEQLAMLTTAIQEEVRNLSAGTAEGPSWPAGIAAPARPKTRYEAFQWDYFTDKNIFKNDNSRNSRPLEGVDTRDVAAVTDFGKNLVLAKFPDYQFQRLISGYRKFDPTRGMDYVVDLEFSVSGGGENLLKRVHLVRPLSRVELIPVPYVTEVKEIRLVLPVEKSQVEAARAFVQRFAHVCMDSSDSSRLSVILLTDSGALAGAVNQEFLPLIQEIRVLRDQYDASRGGKPPSMQILKMRGNSKLTVTDVVNGVIEKLGGENLYLLINPWLELHLDFLNRVRMNTIRGFQVFFPVPFVQFNPKIAKYSNIPKAGGQSPRNGGSGKNQRKNSGGGGNGGPDSVEVHKNIGHFDAEDFNIASFYGSDFQSALKQSDTDHSTRGDLSHVFLNINQLHIMRSVDPDLRILYHEKVCNPQLAESDYSRCLISRKKGLASRAQLATMILLDMQK